MNVTRDLVLLGNLLVDDLVFADGTTRMAEPGGALLHAAFAAALWGARVGIVAPLGEDYPGTALAQLRSRGVALDGLVPMHRPGVRAWLLYEGRVRRIIHRLGCPSHEEASPTPGQIPAAWRGARAFHLAPMPLACQSALVHAIRSDSDMHDAFVSLDPHESITSATLPQWRALLEQVDAFFPSEDEWALTAPAEDPRAALCALAGGRLRTIVLKRGTKGGLCHDAHANRTIEWRARAERVVDPTGAGDAFAMGFVTAYLELPDPERALSRARVSASFALEAWGSEGLAQALPTDALQRLADWTAEESPT